MSGSRGSGFTIIEVMLFLAISGLMAVGILAGAGVAINVQRYKDATYSMESFIQSQYDKTANVQNDRKNLVKCDGAVMSELVAGGMDPDPETTRGAALNCYIYGRLLTVAGDGKTIMAQPVYGGAATGDNDIESLGSAGLFVDIDHGAEVIEKYTPEWSTHLERPQSEQPISDWRLLIVRSPTSGAIRTFTTFDNTLTTLSAVIGSSSSRSDVRVCLNSDGLMGSARKGIVIVKDASAASGVSMINGNGDC